MVDAPDNRSKKTLSRSPHDNPRGLGELVRRVISSVFLIVFAGIAFASGKWGFLGLLVTVLMIAWSEWSGMTMGTGRTGEKAIGFVSLLAILLAADFWGAQAAFAIFLIACFLLVLAGMIRPFEKEHPFNGASFRCFFTLSFWSSRFWSVAGLVFLALPAVAMLEMYTETFVFSRHRVLPDGPFDSGSIGIIVPGIHIVVWLVCVIVTFDIGAYFSGRFFGGAKLIPSISPNKTRAGLYGGTIAAGVTGGLLSLSIDMAHGQRTAVISCAILIALAAQIGDILESAVKRRFSYKDSSRLIPGHGGVLDRYDSFTVAVPLSLFLLRIFEFSSQ